MITAHHSSVWIGPPHTIHEFIKHSKWFPSEEFAFCRSNQVGSAELHKLMLRAEEEAVVLCRPYYTLDFLLYTLYKMVLCRPASGSLRHPLNLTTSLFARMHFSFIQLQAPVVAYFPQQWHCCVPSRSMGDQIGVVDSGPSVCSEPHKCESDVWGAAAVEV